MTSRNSMRTPAILIMFAAMNSVGVHQPTAGAVGNGQVPAAKVAQEVADEVLAFERQNGEMVTDRRSLYHVKAASV